MDNKRNVFLSATIIYNLLLLLIPISTGIKYSIEAGVGSFIVTFLVNILLSFLFQLIYTMIKDEGDMDTFCLFTIGFLTFGFRKRIYYSELGYFYMRKYKDKLIISKQSYFYSKKLFSINISDDLESIKRPDFIKIDSDTIRIENYAFKINLTDMIFIETQIDKNGLINYSNKKRIIKETVNNGIVSFKTIDGIDYNLEIFKDHAELTIESDHQLKWTGKYDIDFSIMLKR